MKKIKKNDLKLNKEIISLLSGHELSSLKGGDIPIQTVAPKCVITYYLFCLADTQLCKTKVEAQTCMQNTCVILPNTNMCPNSIDRCIEGPEVGATGWC